MQIEEQIKALLRTKAKIDLYRSLLSHVEMYYKEPVEAEHAGMTAEFAEEVSSYLSKQIDYLGNPQKPNPVPAAMPQGEPLPVSRAAKPQPTTNSDGEPQDPLKFLLKYRHLDSKKVIVSTPDGDVGAIVRGVKPPLLVIETETGYTANVPPSTVREVRE